jgi:hypothetical protein
MTSRVLKLSLVQLLVCAAGAAARTSVDEEWVVPEGGLVLDGGDAETSLADEGSCLDPSLADGTATAPSLAASTLAAGAPDSQAAAQPRPMAFEYSDGYRTRLKIHKYASFATLPLFVAPFAVGQELYNGNGSDSTRSWHGALAAGTAVLFGVNTVTGVWNLSEGRKDTALRWKERDGCFQCPRHESKYQPDGTFISSRATRNMDRLAIRRDGDRLVVALDRLFRSDQQPQEWGAAAVSL